MCVCVCVLQFENDWGSERTAAASSEPEAASLSRRHCAFSAVLKVAEAERPRRGEKRERAREKKRGKQSGWQEEGAKESGARPQSPRWERERERERVSE